MSQLYGVYGAVRGSPADDGEVTCSCGQPRKRVIFNRLLGGAFAGGAPAALECFQGDSLGAAWEVWNTTAEAAGDEEQLLDLICEANELQDALRNFESFEAFWDPSWSFRYNEVSLKPVAESCWMLRELLPPDACRDLFRAVASRGFGADAGDASRFGQRSILPGRVLRSDDEALAQLLWQRAATVALPLLRAKPGWHAAELDSRITYEELPGGEAAWRVDNQDCDDRDDFKPFFSLLLCVCTAEHDGAGGVFFRPDAETAPVPLVPGAGVLFPRSQAFRYQIHQSDSDSGTRSAAVAHMKVLFGQDG
ncbi:unnamed protein product [Symbiodinium natans]|uniref:Uncharacterized protein n=1 Tax=Symbiodinium natans TaxID=878477 RepID=A0A812J955_9DINO|nr:unnamed protein product [Symbiodinium natans]